MDEAFGESSRFRLYIPASPYSGKRRFSCCSSAILSTVALTSRSCTCPLSTTSVSPATLLSVYVLTISSQATMTRSRELAGVSVQVIFVVCATHDRVSICYRCGLWRNGHTFPCTHMTNALPRTTRPIHDGKLQAPSDRYHLLTVRSSRHSSLRSCSSSLHGV